MKPTTYNAGQYVISLTENAGQFVDQTDSSINYVDTDRMVIKKIGEKPFSLEFRKDTVSVRHFDGKQVTEDTNYDYAPKKTLLDAKTVVGKKRSLAETKIGEYLRIASNQVTGRSAPKNTL